MSSKGHPIAVLGSGCWGTALAHHLGQGAHDVRLWGIDHQALENIKELGENTNYFPGEKLSKNIHPTKDLKEALSGAKLVVFVVPCSVMRKVARSVAAELSKDTLVVTTAKGLEVESLKTMSEVLAEELGAEKRIAALSGPSFAIEVLKGLPTAVTIAAKDEKVAQTIADIFHHGNFRAYTSTDIIGVQVGGAVKNVIAVAAGMVDGVGMGHNARAALITRGIAEIQRMIMALGGEAHTVAGLSGVGDLILTATGDLSRNRTVGFRLAKGEKLEDIVKDLGQVAEAVSSADVLWRLADKLGVSVPITEQVKKILDGESSVEVALKELMGREQTAEF